MYLNQIKLGDRVIADGGFATMIGEELSERSTRGIWFALLLLHGKAQSL